MWFLCLGGVLCLSACSKESEPVEISEDQKEKVLVALVAADAVDGETDKIIKKCATCALRMDGKDEHAMQLEGYTLQFCSKRCRDICAKTPVDILLKTQ